MLYFLHMETPQIDPTKYQVFLCTSPCNVLIGYLAHTWFVVNEMGKVSRWEIYHHPNRPPGIYSATIDTYKTWDFLHCNYRPPFEGISKFTFFEKFHWEGSLVNMIEGDAQSLAAQMAAFITETPKTYSFCKTYGLTGPNCNTYTQWILDQFPTCTMKLPWNSIGGGYNYRTHPHYRS